MTENKMLMILIFLENLLSQKRWDKIDFYFDYVELQTLDAPSMLAILTITFYAKDKLTKRDSFLNRVEVILKNDLGEERAEALLRERR